MKKKITKNKETSKSRTLSDKDYSLVLNSLKHPPKPNSALKASYKKIMAACKIDRRGRAIYNIVE